MPFDPEYKHSGLGRLENIEAGLVAVTSGGSIASIIQRTTASKQGVTDLIEPPPLVAPLTFTYGGSTATVSGSTITAGSTYPASPAPKFYRWDNPNVLWIGGVPAAYTAAGWGSTIGAITVPVADGSRTLFGQLGYMCSRIYSDSFEILIYGSPSTIRVFLDGQPHATAVYTTTKNDNQLWCLKIGNLPRGRDYYDVKVETSASVIGGFVLRPSDVISAPAGSVNAGSMIVVGDSYAIAQNLAAWVAWPHRLARRFGYDRVFVSGFGGTGILANNILNVGTTGGNYRSRLTADRASLPNDVSFVVVQGSTNDGNYAIGDGGTALNAEIAALVAYVQAQWTNATIVFTSTLRCGNPTANDLSVSALYKAKCAALGITYIDQIAAAHYTGTGTSVAPTGDGNADWLLQTDASHPTSDGQRDIADWLSEQIAIALSLPAAARTVIPRIDDGQAGALAPPDIPNTTVTPAAQRVSYARFVARRRLKVTKIAFVLTTAASVNDNVEVGIYDASGARVATSGLVAGKLNGALGVQTVTVTATLEPGIYYAAINVATIGGTAAVILGYALSNALGYELFGTGAPAALGGQQTGQATLPATAVITSVTGSVISLAVRET
jgi:hypothetical protein